LTTDEMLLRITQALERMAPAPAPAADPLAHAAYHWDGRSIVVINNFAPLPFDLIVGVDRQKAAVLENSCRLAQGFAAHDVLLWGARGMGKSALVKSAVAALQKQGQPIALIEVASAKIAALPVLFAQLDNVERPYLVFIDDIGFDDSNEDARCLRSMLEGGAEARPANFRLYVTSNRRNIIARDPGSDPGSNRDMADDQLALADRFGLKLGFQYPDQTAYLEMISSYADHFELHWNERDALAFAHERGNRSGRTAWHYAVEIAGRAGRTI
jgi:uncharacterized protein